MNVLEVESVGKTFTMHLQGGLRLPVVKDVSFQVARGDCVVLSGPSGCGKSSILKMIFGSYRCGEGRIAVTANGVTTDACRAEPRQMLALRRHTIGYVTQFLRAVPRVAALDVVAEPLVMDGFERDAARKQAGALLTRLNIAQRLWGLPPATFSGGEQQRVNVARGFLPSRPILLLDEPTASLDATNRAVVVDLVRRKKAEGVAIVGIVHDDEVRDAIADSIIDMTRFAAGSEEP